VRPASSAARLSVLVHRLIRGADHRRTERPMGLDDKIKNAAQDVAGKAKEAIGNATNDDEKVAEGKRDQSAASAKQAGENVKDVFKN
jgi:uncharacterized protein YjbJ (UPF0337 family)